MRHIVIIPARNEAGQIERTLRSILGQQEKPDRTYVVDDGSGDGTASVVTAFSMEDSSVILVERPDRGFRKVGAGVVEAFNIAYETVRGENFTYVSKIDADVVMEPDYFRILLGRMDGQRNLAIAGGNLYEELAGRLVRIRIPDYHVPGSLKTMRKSIFDEMNGFISVLGWDIIDETKAHMLGYKTRNFKDLKVIHLRQHASAEGILKGKSGWGKAAYAIGSHPLFVLGRGFYRMLERPYVIGGIALWYGYLRAVLRREPQIEDKNLIAYLRREQLHRLIAFNRIPEGNQ